jgi:hypothetical protein
VRDEASKECTDINECTVLANTCGEGFTCVNTKGNFACECTHPARVVDEKCVHPPKPAPTTDKKKKKASKKTSGDDDDEDVTVMDSINISGGAANFNTKPKQKLCQVCKDVGKKFEEVRALYQCCCVTSRLFWLAASF